MSKESFAALIVKALDTTIGNSGSTYSASTAILAQKAIAEAITRYLIANTSIVISYDGVLNAGGADVIASDTMKITGSCKIPDTPSQFDAWVAALQSSIASGFVVKSPSTQGVTATFQPFSDVFGALQISQLKLKIAHENNIIDPALSVWMVICGGILDWLNSISGKNPTVVSVPATRAEISSGTATFVSIKVT